MKVFLADKYAVEKIQAKSNLTVLHGICCSFADMRGSAAADDIV